MAVEARRNKRTAARPARLNFCKGLMAELHDKLKIIEGKSQLINFFQKTRRIKGEEEFILEMIQDEGPVGF